MNPKPVYSNSKIVTMHIIFLSGSGISLIFNSSDADRTVLSSVLQPRVVQ
jgi:hypothetical protein